MKKELEEAKTKDEKVEEQIESAIKIIKERAREDDSKSSSLSLREILGGDILTTQVVRSQVWLLVIIVGFVIAYVAFRYQCQQDFIAIDKMEKELKDAKYRALTTSSTLTEKSRESRVLDELKNKVAAVLKQALGIAVRVKLVEPKTIQRSEGKAKRVIDNREL